MNSEAAQQQCLSAIIQTRLRLNDLSDWASRHELPDNWSFSTCAHANLGVETTIHLEFPSYKAANAWEWMHCHGHDEPKRILFATFISIDLKDFQVLLRFPASTHPDVLNPELAHLS